MTAAKLAVASVLLLWFLWKARENRLFLLGIPVLMVMGESVFFDLMRPFWTPGRFDPQTHIMGWLFVVWAAIMVMRIQGAGRARPFGPARILPEELALLAFALVVLVQVGIASVPDVDLSVGVVAGRDMLFLLLGYLMLRGVVSRFTRAQVIEFLTSVVVVNTLAAALYVAHQGLGLEIYTGGEYFSTQYAGVEITRTFHFAPMFTLPALAFVLARPRWTPFWLTVLTVTVLSVLVSYTRTLFIAVIVAVVIAVLVRELKDPDSGRFLRRVLVVAGTVAAIMAVFAVILPAQSEFLVSRLTEFSGEQGMGDIHNWQVRERKYDMANQIVLERDPYFGLGFPPEGSNPVDSQVYRLSADMTWIPILYHTGYVGLALMGAVLVGFALRALRLTFADDEARRYLGMVYLITIALTVLVAFTAWTFMQPQIAPMGLWMLAFLAAEALAPGRQAQLTPAAAEDAGEEAA